MGLQISRVDTAAKFVATLDAEDMKIEAVTTAGNYLGSAQLKDVAPHIHELAIRLDTLAIAVKTLKNSTMPNAAKLVVESPGFKKLIEETSYIFAQLKNNSKLRNGLNNRIKEVNSPPPSTGDYHKDKQRAEWRDTNDHDISHVNNLFSQLGYKVSKDDFPEAQASLEKLKAMLPTPSRSR